MGTQGPGGVEGPLTPCRAVSGASLGTQAVMASQLEGGPPAPRAETEGAVRSEDGGTQLRVVMGVSPGAGRAGGWTGGYPGWGSWKASRA